MTEILVLLCLIIAGLELYLGLGRRRPGADSGRISALEASQAGLTGRLSAAEARDRDREQALAEVAARLENLALTSGTPDVDELRGALRRLEDAPAELDGRVWQLDALARALETNVSALREQVRELVDRLDHDVAPAEAAVARIHSYVRGGLDREIVETLGGEPADSRTLPGALSGDLAPLESSLTRLYERLVDQAGLRVRLQVGEPEGTRYYLACPADRGPVELEWELMSLLDVLRDPGARHDAPGRVAALSDLLTSVRGLDKGFVQLGPLVVVRTPDSLLAGVLSVRECRDFDTGRMLADLHAAASRLQELPDSRFLDLS